MSQVHCQNCHRESGRVASMITCSIFDNMWFTDMILQHNASRPQSVKSDLAKDIAAATYRMKYK